MAKNARVYRVLVLMLALSFVSTAMISSTFAKYVSEYSGQDTALVARWSFDGSVGDEGEDETLYLFKHDYDLHVNQMSDDKYIIAPGVNGEFTIALEYLADVDADVTISVVNEGDLPSVQVDETPHQLPIEYSADDGETWVLIDDLAEAVAGAISDEHGWDLLEGGVPGFRMPATEGQEASLTVKWRWAYDAKEQGENPAVESNDDIDTLFGQAAAAAEGIMGYGVTITVRATQVEPEKGN